MPSAFLARCTPGFLALGLLSCGASRPVGDLVKSGRWLEACHALEKQEMGSDDLSRYDVASELSGHVPVKVGARALLAADVEKRIGALQGGSLRLPPFDSRMLQPMFDLSKMPPGDPFERDWLVLEMTIEVDGSAAAPVGLGTVEIEERSRASQDASHPWAPRWNEASPWVRWTPTPGAAKPPEQELATTMGLLREGGTSAPTLWSMLDLGGLVLTGGLIDFKSRGASPLLLAKAFPGRQPTPGEQAAIQKLVALTQVPHCTAVAPGASCTERVLLRRSSPARVNAILIPLLYSLGNGPTACQLDRSFRAPLPPARTVHEQLDTVFGQGQKPLAELEKRESEFEHTSEPCSGDAAKCPPPADCGSSAGCSLEGACRLEGGACAARGVDCENRAYCDLIGTCVAREGHCSTPAEAAEGCEHACAWYGKCEKSGGTCGAGSAAQCASSLACKRFGACQKDLYSCAPASSADCAGSEACKERGWCTLKERTCLAASDTDCAAATVCRTWGACRAEGGMCVSGK